MQRRKHLRSEGFVDVVRREGRLRGVVRKDLAQLLEAWGKSEPVERELVVRQVIGEGVRWPQAKQRQAQESASRDGEP